MSLEITKIKWECLKYLLIGVTFVDDVVEHTPWYLSVVLGRALHLRYRCKHEADEQVYAAASLLPGVAPSSSAELDVPKAAF